MYWWLWRRRNWWSLCRIPALRRARRHFTLIRWHGQGLRGLRWILRNRGVWPSLVRCGRVYMAPSGAHHSWYGREVDCSSSSWWPWGMEWWGICFTRRQWALRNRGRLCEMVSWRPLNRKFEWLLTSLLAIKWPLAFRMASGWCKIFRINVWLMRNDDFWCEIVMQKFSHWELLMWNIFALRSGSVKIFVVRKGDAKFFALSSHWEWVMRNFSHWVSHWEWAMRNFLHWLFILRSALFSSVFYFPCFLS